MSIYDKIDNVLDKIDKYIDYIIHTYKLSKNMDNGHMTITNFLENIGLTGSLDSAVFFRNLKNDIPKAFKKTMNNMLIIMLLIFGFFSALIIGGIIVWSLLILVIAYPGLMLVLMYIALMLIIIWIKTDGYIIDYIKELIEYTERKIEGFINGQKKKL